MMQRFRKCGTVGSDGLYLRHHHPTVPRMRHEVFHRPRSNPSQFIWVAADGCASGQGGEDRNHAVCGGASENVDEVAGRSVYLAPPLLKPCISPLCRGRPGCDLTVVVAALARAVRQGSRVHEGQGATRDADRSRRLSAMTCSSRCPKPFLNGHLAKMIALRVKICSKSRAPICSHTARTNHGSLIAPDASDTRHRCARHRPMGASP